MAVVARQFPDSLRSSFFPWSLGGRPLNMQNLTWLFIREWWRSSNAMISGYSGQKRAASAQLANRHAGCKSGNRRANSQVRKSQSLGEASASMLDRIPSIGVARRSRPLQRSITRMVDPTVSLIVLLRTILGGNARARLEVRPLTFRLDEAPSRWLKVSPLPQQTFISSPNVQSEQTIFLLASTCWDKISSIMRPLPLIYFLLIAFTAPAQAQALPDPLPIPRLVEKCGPAVVTVTTSKSLGSGFNVDSLGIIITNLHVVKGSDRIQVAFPSGERFDVTDLLGIDRDRDIAILRVSGFDLPTVPMGNSNDVAIGSSVVAIGNPQDFKNTVSSGLLSGRREMHGMTRLQTTAPISPGSSGGPLFDQWGNVIGITTLTWIEDGSQSLNFCIPINYARGLLSNPQHIPLLNLLDPNLTTRSADTRQTRPRPSPPDEADFARIISNIPESSVIIRVVGPGQYTRSEIKKAFDVVLASSNIKSPTFSDLQYDRLWLLYARLHPNTANSHLHIAQLRSSFYLEVDLHAKPSFFDALIPSWANSAALSTDVASAILYDPFTLRELHRFTASTGGGGNKIFHKIMQDLQQWAQANCPSIITNSGGE